MRKLTALILAGALGLAACGGDDDSSDNGDETTGETTDETTDEGGSDTTDGDDGGTDTTVSTGNDDLDELLQQAREARVRVTYSSGEGAGTFTISQDDPRFALISEGSRIVQDDEGLFLCSDGADCIALPGEAGEAQLTALTTGFFGLYGAFLAFDDVEDSPFVDVSESTTEEIAGREARCVTTTLTGLAGQGGEVRACIDTETGVFLLGETVSSDDTTSRIEAIEFGEPQDSDFEH